jgi:hypothetical protein
MIMRLAVSLSMTINPKKSLCINYKWENGNLQNDKSIFQDINQYEGPKFGFRYLGFFLIYNQAGGENSKWIKARVDEKIKVLKLRRVHSNWSITILLSIAHGIVRYFSQLGMIT